MSEDIQDLIKRLSVGADTRPQQPAFPQGTQGDYPSRVGTGSRYASTVGAGRKSDQIILRETEFEVLTVYSYILVTEDGAFEHPTNWPTSGLYPNPTQVYTTVPEVLEVVGSQYGLAVDASTYQQRRVHTIYYKTPNVPGFRVEHMNVELEQPYRKKGFYTGLIPMAWEPQVSTVGNIFDATQQRSFTTSPFLCKLYMSLNRYYDDQPDIQTLANNLTRQGITIENT